MAENDLYASMVLDRSGSMSSVWEGALAGVNGFIAEQVAEPGRAWVTFTAFDDEIITPWKAWGMADFPKNWGELEHIRPRGSTALYDAIAANLAVSDTWLEANPWFDGKKVCVIVTDGYENASRTYDRDAIFKIVREHEANGWTFVYLAANQDAWAAASSIGVTTKGSTQRYAHTNSGVTNTYAGASASIGSLRSTGNFAPLPDDAEQVSQT